MFHFLAQDNSLQLISISFNWNDLFPVALQEFYDDVFSEIPYSCSLSSNVRELKLKISQDTILPIQQNSIKLFHQATNYM